jgi:hypothetical protein
MHKHLVRLCAEAGLAAALIGAVSFAAAQAPAKPAHAKKAPAKPGKTAAAPGYKAGAPLPAATPEQIEAAELVYTGHYECEFDQAIDIKYHEAQLGYVDVQYGKNAYLMKPVLSSTGAVRLEDMRGETLMVQIGSKSMLLNTKTGRRLVDECVSPRQREAVVAAQQAKAAEAAASAAAQQASAAVASASAASAAANTASLAASAASAAAAGGLSAPALPQTPKVEAPRLEPSKPTVKLPSLPSPPAR